MCSRETAPELVARYAFRKAAEVATKLSTGLVLAGDTVAGIHGQILGKPRDRDHADEMLRTLAGTHHDVFTGVCLWSVQSARCVVDVVRTRLQMQPLSDADRLAYLETGKWEGKAGAFGYQDGNAWLSVLEGGSESNVVGLPMERLAELLKHFDSLAETVETDGLGPRPAG
ncbi:MAG: Maf family protein [Planctomycetota bacterium]